jgi:hypothetical protein
LFHKLLRGESDFRADVSAASERSERERVSVAGFRRLFFAGVFLIGGHLAFRPFMG